MGVIRLVLAISVVIAHTSSIFGLSFVGGTVAVEAFFIISGFYMSLILNEKYVGENGSYRLFLTNRFLRLFPIYWVVLLLVVGFSIMFAFHSHFKYWGPLDYYAKYHDQMGFGTYFYLFFCNVLIVGQDLALFQGLDTSTGSLFFTSNFWSTEPFLYKFLLIPQAWSVSIELIFYLIAPFIVRRDSSFIMVLIGLSVLIRIVLSSNGLVDDPWNYRFFPNEMVFFLLGNLSYKMYKRIQDKEISILLLRVIASALILFTLLFGNINFSFKMQLYFGLFFLALPFIFKLSKRSEVDMAVGELSYPIYLVHVFLIPIIIKIPYLQDSIGLGAAVTMAALGLSIVLVKYIAKPIERFRQGRLGLVKAV